MRVRGGGGGGYNGRYGTKKISPCSKVIGAEHIGPPPTMVIFSYERNILERGKKNPKTIDKQTKQTN